MSQRIAIVGSGIAGLGAAWALQSSNEVVVYEADSRIGGHSNTVDVPTSEGVTSVDTGFIVYNEVTYPNLTRLFETLNVPTEFSDMSFAFSMDGRLEYAASLGGVLAQPSNLLRTRFRAMLRDIGRFRRTGAELSPTDHETVDDLFSRHGFSAGFREDYLYPMAGAIWSAGRAEIGSYPAQSILEFLANHGLIEIVGRPRWKTVTGGSRSYVERLTAGFRDNIRLETPVTGITRDRGQVEVHSREGSEVFDHVVLATHSDQAIEILGPGVTQRERDLLAAIPYQDNVAFLHSDPALMPTRRRVWSSWNALAASDLGDAGVASVTYWMNRLQNLDTRVPLFVSLNPLHEPKSELVHATFSYVHPQFGTKAIPAQRGIAEIQGLNNTWFAGAYLGYGFHEDGLQSGLNVAAALGSPAPWHGSFAPMSSAPAPARIGSSG
ncbi:MAG: FAD-dependent oxidoreductase [Acidimicrobiia bacterium]